MTEQADGAAEQEHEPDRGGNGRSTGREETTSGPSRSGQPGRQSRPRQGGQSADLLTDFQRWLIKSSAKNMRKEISGQVRRSLGGGRSDSADVWDTATTESPADAGESAECQWCPICRAARRMRESGPGLGDHLSSAGDLVASAVQEAFRAFETVVARSGTEPRGGYHDGEPGDPVDWAAARDAWAAEHGAMVTRPGATAAAHDASPAEPEAGGAETPEQAAARDSDRQQDLSDVPEGPDEPDDRG